MSSNEIAVRWRLAREEDFPLVAELHYQLIRDEGHWDPMPVSGLQIKIKNMVAQGCAAILFEDDREALGYAIYNEEEYNIFLLQFFVQRGKRRNGIGRAAMHLLFSEVWSSEKRISVHVLCHNLPGVEFWHSMGFSDYGLTLEKLPPPTGSQSQTQNT